MTIFTLNRTPQARKTVLSKFFTILFTVFFTLTTSWASAQTATIATDQPDYAPGATATITGTGFSPQEVVTLQVEHVGSTSSDESHLPWQVNADENGNISTIWVVDPDALGATLLLTADGQSSGLHAETLFTDANPTPVSITTLGIAYTQNFNSLASTGTTNTTIPIGWGFLETGSGANITYAAGTGSDNGGNTYSFGATSNSERALGSLLSGSVVPYIGFSFTNNTGSTITSLTISYTGEQWRLGTLGRTDRLDFQYLNNATNLTAGTWNDVDALDFTAPVTAGTIGALNGNTSPNRTAISFTITGLSIADGATFWIRWTDFNATDADDGLAIDDFSLTPNATAPLPPCSTPDPKINTVTNVSCFGGSNGAINIDVTPPSDGTLSYVWKNGSTALPATTQDITGLSAGTVYNVTVTNANSGVCITSTATLANIAVTQPLSALTATETHINISCNGGSDGSVIIGATGGTTPYITGTGSFNNLSAVTNVPYLVTDANGCTATVVVTITEPPALSLSETHLNVACNGGTSGSVTISATGGTSPYTGTGTYDNLAAGTYTYTVTDAKNCTKNIVVTISEPSLINLSEVHTDVSCNSGNNGTIDLTVGGGSPANPGGTVTYTQTFDGLVSGLPAGWFFVETGTNANSSYTTGNGSSNTGDTYSFGSTGSTDRALGTLLSGSLVSTIGAGSLFSNNTGNVVKSITINYTGEQWRLGTTGRADKLDFQYSTNATSLTTGNWINVDALDFTSPNTGPTVGALDGNSAANRTALSATITGLSIPVNGKFWIKWLDADAANSDDGLGIDDFNMTMNSVTSPYTYLWTPGNSTSEDLSALTAGTYTVTVADANGCTATKVIGVAEPALISFTATPVQPKCFGEKGSVILSTPTGGTGSISFDATPVSGLDEGDYTYTATDANGCTAKQTVHINAAPAAINFTATPVQPKCFGEKGSVILNTPTGGTGSISFDATPVSGLDEGDYTYTATDANGCTAKQTVHINAAPTAINFTATPVQPKCSGEKGSIILSSPTGGTGSISFDATPVSGLDEGDYTYTATDANGCTAKQTVHIDAAPAAVIATVIVTQPKCAGDNGTITVSATGGNGNYGVTVGTFAVASGAAYSYTVTDGNGCTSNIISGTMGAAPAAISFTATPVQPKCAGEKGSVTLSTPAGGTGNITFDATPTSGLSAGSYTYTATDANGCTTKQTVIIDAAPSALIAGSSATAILCNGGTSEITVTATGGTAPYSGTGTFTVSGGTYSYTVTDANGCSAVTSGNIKQPAALVASCLNNNPIVYFGYAGDQTSTITVSPTGGTAPYKIELTLNRAIKCNQVTDAGDEVWSAAGGATTGAGCPVYPSTASTAPLSVKTGVLGGGSYAVTVSLMENAYIIATITDANGCISTCSTYVHADDVRCFAGNSGNVKVTLCHRTGNSKTPCVTICVDNDAVAEHLAHGDFLGKCTPNCVAPATRPAAPIIAPLFANELTVKVMPNPTPNYFNVAITGKNNNPVTVRVMDIYGRVIQLDQKIAPNATLRLGQKWAGGTYLVEVLQGEERKVVKVIKAN